MQSPSDRNLPSVSVARRRAHTIFNLAVRSLGSTGDEYSVGVDRGVRGRTDVGADDMENRRLYFNHLLEAVSSDLNCAAPPDFLLMKK